ncbi:unnamed protein product [Clonostachys rosea]|uniref:Aromatic-L-amino-acid decarboxylase n=1 Tax=Bionectria ochroleuca TaxID=29856 RepID=A0ABY6V5T8_BIOOC|nr:unnamed protein product [Clonostachys rosea]
MSQQQKPGMTADDFRKAAHAAIEEIISYNENIAQYRVLPTVKPGYLAPQLPRSAPEIPETWENIQPDIAEKIVPGLTHWQSPNFMAYFPGCSTYPSLLGEMYSAAFSAPAFNWLCSPVCTELETVVLDWVAKGLSLPSSYLSDCPSGGGGVIQGSASEAVVTCMVAARERYLHAKCDAEGLENPSPERDARIAALRPKLVALSSDQAHSSTMKGSNIAGTLHHSIVTSRDNALAVTGDDLTLALEKVRSQGLEPYYITLTIGSTSTCAIDDFESLKSVFDRAENAQIWKHIDAAYAGAALFLPEYAKSLAPFTAMVDSFNTNFHKWLLVNFDASCLFVQNRNHLTRALSISAPYYQNKHSDSGLVTDYRDWQIPLGRRFRALKIWFMMRTYGLSGIREHLAHTIKLGDLFADLVRSRSDLFEIVAEPRFALTCFRVKPSALTVSTTSALTNGDASEVEANSITRQITDRINAEGTIHIIGSSAAGQTFIRVVSANSNAEEKYIRGAFEVIVKITEEALKERREQQ